MEDEFISEIDIGNGNSLFCVFDGHGGNEAAQFVKEHLLNELTNSSAYKRKEYKSALKDAILRVDKLLWKHTLNNTKSSSTSSDEVDEDSDALTEQHKSGCTANVVLITPENIYCANVGDSRSIMCKSGKCV